MAKPLHPTNVRSTTMIFTAASSESCSAAGRRVNTLTLCSMVFRHALSSGAASSFWRRRFLKKPNMRHFELEITEETALKKASVVVNGDGTHLDALLRCLCFLLLNLPPAFYTA